MVYYPGETEKDGIETIEGSEVFIEKATFHSANILTIRAGTNTPQGGDTGHGGRTLLELQNEAATDMRVEIERDTVSAEPNAVSKVRIILGGDTEAKTFIGALEFALNTLKEQHESKHDS